MTFVKNQNKYDQNKYDQNKQERLQARREITDQKKKRVVHGMFSFFSNILAWLKSLFFKTGNI
jgi:hypothetical protein